MPSEITATQKSFKVTPAAGIFYLEANDMLKKTAETLSKEIGRISGMTLQVSSFSDISPKRIIITGKTVAGCFYGTKTLPQAFQPTTDQEGYMTIATGSVYDFPQYSCCEAILDVVRHFFTVDNVKRY